MASSSSCPARTVCTSMSSPAPACGQTPPNDRAASTRAVSIAAELTQRKLESVDINQSWFYLLPFHRGTEGRFHLSQGGTHRSQRPGGGPSQVPASHRLPAILCVPERHRTPWPGLPSGRGVQRREPAMWCARECARLRRLVRGARGQEELRQE